MLEPEFKETKIGQATVRAIFKINKVGTIAGCRVTQGEIRRNAKIRVIRNGSVVFEGEVSSLKHEKDDVKEVRQGFDCGISLKGYNDVIEGDSLESYILEKTAK
jgi:translation initiation factor IF-2